MATETTTTKKTNKQRPAEPSHLYDVNQPAALDSPLAAFYEEGELAAALYRDKRTLRRWHALRVGPPRTVLGRSIFYNKESVTRWLIEREQRPARRK
jgi:hypothetical protein